MSTIIVNDEAIFENSRRDESRTTQPFQEAIESEELGADRPTPADNSGKGKPAKSGKEASPFFLNVAQAAKFAGIPESTINRWLRINPSPIPSMKLGGMRRFAHPVLAKWCRRASAERNVPTHRLAQITTQLLDEWNRLVYPSAQRAHSPSSSSGQRAQAKPEVGKGLRLRTRDMYRKYVLGDGDEHAE